MKIKNLLSGTRHLPFAAIAGVALAAAPLQGQTILFADNFDRGDSSDLNASADGKSGILGALEYTEVNFRGLGGPVDTAIVSNQLSIKGNGNNGVSKAYLNHNFTDAIIAGGGTFTVSLDIVAQSSAGNGRQLGFGVGQNSAELDASTGISGDSDVWVGYDNIGTTTGIVVAHNGVAQGTTPFPADLPDLPDTMSVVYTFADLDAGTPLNYEVFLDGTSVLTGTSAWSGTNENYLSLHSSMSITGNADNFVVSAPGDAPSSSFTITAIKYAPGTPTVTLTWRKTAAASYRAKYSLDMTNWSAELSDGLDDGIDENPGNTDHLTVTFDLSEIGIENEEKVFFRIEEE